MSSELRDIIESEKRLPLPEYASLESKFGYNFRGAVEQGFVQFSADPPNSENARRLLVYGSQLPDQFHFLRQKYGLPQQQAESYLNCLPEEILESEFFSMAKRLESETKYLEELEEVGITASILDQVDHGKYGAFVRFISPESLIGRHLSEDGNTNGFYVPVLDTIAILKQPSSSKEIWQSLASKGTLPATIMTLEHELVHDTQYSKGQRLTEFIGTGIKWAGYGMVVKNFGVLQGAAFLWTIGNVIDNVARKLSENDSNLGEIQAYSAEADSPCNGDENLDEKIEIVSHVFAGYDVTKEELGSLIRGYDQILSLRLLGLNEHEIGKRINRAHFDESIATYPKLDEKIVDIAEEWGIENVNQLHYTLRASLSRREMEKTYQRALAKKIAAECLITASDRANRAANN